MASRTFAKWSYKIRHFNFIMRHRLESSQKKSMSKRNLWKRFPTRVCTRFCCICCSCCCCCCMCGLWVLCVCVCGLTFCTYAREQSHLLWITLGKVPITNCSEYSYDGWILKGVDSHDEHVPIETRKDKITAAQCAHGTHQCLCVGEKGRSSHKLWSACSKSSFFFCFFFMCLPYPPVQFWLCLSDQTSSHDPARCVAVPAAAVNRRYPLRAWPHHHRTQCTVKGRAFDCTTV